MARRKSSYDCERLSEVLRRTPGPLFSELKVELGVSDNTARAWVSRCVGYCGIKEVKTPVGTRVFLEAHNSKEIGDVVLFDYTPGQVSLLSFIFTHPFSTTEELVDEFCSDFRTREDRWPESTLHESLSTLKKFDWITKAPRPFRLSTGGALDKPLHDRREGWVDTMHLEAMGRPNGKLVLFSQGDVDQYIRSWREEE